MHERSPAPSSVFGSDPDPDPAVADALRLLEPGPPLDRVDWTGLWKRSTEGAEEGLRRLRRQALWFRAGRWARPGVPAAAVAVLVLAAALANLPGPGSPSPGEGSFQARLERALVAGTAEVGLLAGAPPSYAALMWEVVGADEPERPSAPLRAEDDPRRP